MRKEGHGKKRKESGREREITTGSDPPASREGEESPALSEQQPRAPEKKRKRSPVPPFLIKVALLAAVIWAVFTFVLGMHIMHGYGMHPNIKDGDLVVTYKLEAYHVGDAVAYKHPETGETVISRIVAIGQNEIQITEIGELLINGSVPEEGVFYPTRQIEDSALAFPYQMSEEGYFLLDDYRTQGSDSRVFGEVQKDDLLGKVVYIFRRRGI